MAAETASLIIKVDSSGQLDPVAGQRWGVTSRGYSGG